LNKNATNGKKVQPQTKQGYLIKEETGNVL